MRSTAKSATAPAPIFSVSQEAVRSLGSLDDLLGVRGHEGQRARSRASEKPSQAIRRSGVRIELDSALAVEDHDGAIVGGVERPVVARHPGAAERPPPPLHLVADPQRGAPVGRGGQQRAEPGAIDVEDRKQLGGMGRPQTRPAQRPRGIVVPVQVGGRVAAVGLGDLPGRRAEGEVAAELNACRRRRVVRGRRR